MSGDIPASYRVSYSQRQLHQLRAMADQAAAAGHRRRFSEALDFIDQRLTNDPFGFGEQTHTLHGMGLPVFLQVHSLICLTYAVDEPRHIVYIRTVRLLLPSPGS